MDARLGRGEDVIQGQHVIRNPDDGWYPALMSAMFLVDNRFQNQGRANLGLSAKHMGDSICFRADVLRRISWGEGLTEDYHLRQKLLLEGTRIAYAPEARGFGEAARSWTQAEKQRTRWICGVQDTRREFKRQLLREGLRRRDAAILDGALHSCLPVYSTLVLIVAALVGATLIVNEFSSTRIPGALVLAWVALLAALFVYPLFGLLLERAPLRAYLVILSGPVFIGWRTWLSLAARFGRRNIGWVRTQHGG
jgi:cellulose synthase/poly-beta-1,6-N-acetylglucosamine synthase-like glycosyltransferase